MVCNRLHKGMCNATKKVCNKKYEVKMAGHQKCIVSKTAHVSTIVKRKKHRKKVEKKKSWFARLFGRK